MFDTKVFDKFAVAHFEDQMIMILNRPESEGSELAQAASGD